MTKTLFFARKFRFSIFFSGKKCLLSAFPTDRRKPKDGLEKSPKRKSGILNVITPTKWIERGLLTYRKTNIGTIISGRMALLVTLFLVLVNIFNSVTANAPKAEGLTAVETWVVMCILHVFCVLAEYAIILKIIQTQKRGIDRARRKAKAQQLLQQQQQQQSQQQNRFGTSLSGTATPRVRKYDGSGESTPFEQLFDNAEEFIRLQQQQQPQQQLTHRCNNAHRFHRQTTRSSLSPPSEDKLHHDFEETPLSEPQQPQQHQQQNWNSLDLHQAPSPPIQQQQQQPHQMHVNKKSIEKIDRCAMYLFPIFFFLFNILYWSYYLILIEHVQKLWWKKIYGMLWIFYEKGFLLLAHVTIT